MSYTLNSYVSNITFVNSCLVTLRVYNCWIMENVFFLKITAHVGNNLKVVVTSMINNNLTSKEYLSFTVNIGAARACSSMDFKFYWWNWLMKSFILKVVVTTIINALRNIHNYRNKRPCGRASTVKIHSALINIELARQRA